MDNHSESLKIYENLVNECKIKRIRDYITNTPLISYMNRDKVLELLTRELKKN